MDPAELEVNRFNTKAFIDANPTSLILTPRTRQDNGEGSSWVDGTPRPVQVVSLIDQSYFRGPVPGTLLSADGTQRQVDYQLLLEHDGQVGLFDYWIDGEGVRWEVLDLLPFNGYERRAKVARYGE